MFYLRYNGKYICSATELSEYKRAALPFRTYQSAVEYRNHLREQYRIFGVSMVRR